MTTYTYAADADVPADVLFAYLADPRNMPRFVPRMTSAEPGDGETVHVEAEVHGHHIEGSAWVRPDRCARRLAWGAEGAGDYYGELQVDEIEPGRSRISVALHSVRAVEGGEVQEDLEQTVATLAQAAAAAGEAMRGR
ncbi:SRPBCC family protein [Actinophytocola sp.]|uniref:SRPBCC family protein n=1 Tax=Actinophytocola sp. TaxID=1872138 RepID=UPI002D2AC95E|nr:SRPBCC family protein [Actinophytocola sp.]HYQ67650.1 SRPBCC family protein [Actinophytocola sp.]